MDEDRYYFHMLRELAGSNGRVEQNTRKQRALERRCWTSESGDRVAATKCSCRRNAVGKRPHEAGRRFGDAGAHMRGPVSEEHDIGFPGEDGELPSACCYRNRGAAAKDVIIALWQSLAVKRRSIITLFEILSRMDEM